jgi:hypothetical protein
MAFSGTALVETFGESAAIVETTPPKVNAITKGTVNFVHAAPVNWCGNVAPAMPDREFTLFIYGQEYVILARTKFMYSCRRLPHRRAIRSKTT